MESLFIGIFGVSLTVAIVLGSLAAILQSDTLGTGAAVSGLIAGASFVALVLIAMS